MTISFFWILKFQTAVSQMGFGVLDWNGQEFQTWAEADRFGRWLWFQYCEQLRLPGTAYTTM